MANAGRPTTLDSERRWREFLWLVASGVGFRDASRAARVHGATIVGMLDDPGFRAYILAELEERAELEESAA